MYAQEFREIKIEYQHSLRIPYNQIDIEFCAPNNEYQIIVKTAQMEGRVGYEYSNTENKIRIEKEYFDAIYNKFLSLNFAEIIVSNENAVGLDGTVIRTTIGSYLNDIVLTVWSPDYDSEKRKLVELDTILREIFLKIGLEEFYE
jgi:hypothetical protein